MISKIINEICQDYKIKKSFLNFYFWKNYFKSPSIKAIFWIRTLLNTTNSKFKTLIKLWLVDSYGIFIGNNVKIGRCLRLPHPNGVIIGDKVVIHDNVTIYQQVTLGAKGIGNNGKKYPIIEDNVILYSGSKIIGNITISRNCKIGANTVVTKTTEEGKTYIGAKATVI